MSDAAFCVVPCSLPSQSAVGTSLSGFLGSNVAVRNFARGSSLGMRSRQSPSFIGQDTRFFIIAAAKKKAKTSRRSPKSSGAQTPAFLSSGVQMPTGAAPFSPAAVSSKKGQKKRQLPSTGAMLSLVFIGTWVGIAGLIGLWIWAQTQKGGLFTPPN
uniref:Uncharacterized protein n=1 Tax=Cyanoptyche gloeocystis TaxID=77922 RepID=A0A7S2JKW8_9EUKA|mmetsp:Transcript_1012/g.1900  ORF Transcript_1012/g.1900 Transcript_1012/m.1900 type:complete len:157 (+) Transcript_1012:53-523(+)|eukprot:CAMPEP_0196658198 /NCGR_PEP_ID=MMETSP1086-20130531/27973_1 /TAXON_ID=77921 /ORGANISM="Cyanoptyche  gloeocystis , Strain SAG4.97" /LENGTH=156 /DNA_ID=CAMNT_0041991661 /DNA_START=53 /DNA_END=523 /DNA_ORIENTATION=-